ncbi:MAG: hypothetical protein LBE07_09490, partial [Gordonia sp. (in: high G+C Gram-positive bacteria)]|nr:hypothetical protein [Gordonia sp. (in: high G+C Gram-positive bacteria)]
MSTSIERPPRRTEFKEHAPQQGTRHVNRLPRRGGHPLDSCTFRIARVDDRNGLWQARPAVHTTHQRGPAVHP